MLEKNRGIELDYVSRGVVEEREQKIKELVSKRQLDLTVVLENIHDIHNILAILRTCDSVGIHQIFVINNYIPEKIKVGKKSSASAKKWVDMHFFTSVSECVNYLKSKDYILLTTAISDDSESIYETDLTQKIALCFGNEKTGISDELLSHANKNFLIPMFGMVESLNVSVAASISVYEACRQRIIKGLYKPKEVDNNPELISMFNTLTWK